MILVVGATGMLGGAITQLLLARGERVRILIRPQSQERATPQIRAGAQVVSGDLKARASLDAACEGIDIVITTATAASRGGDDTPETVDWLGHQNLIDAATRAGVKQFIFVSANFAALESPIPIAAAKFKAETYLRASGLNYTILAPTAFMEGWPERVVGLSVSNGRPVTLIGNARGKISFIARSDVAAYASASISHPAALNQRLVIGGPEALSYRDVVVVYERVLGYLIPIHFANPDEDILDLPPFVVAVLAKDEDEIVDLQEWACALGITPTRLEDFLRLEKG